MNNGGDKSQMAKGGKSQHYFYIGSVDSFERALAEAQAEMQLPPQDYIPVRYNNMSHESGEWLRTLLSLGFTLGLLWYIRSQMMGGMGGMGGKGKGANPFSFGKSPATLIKPGESKVTFKDVAGLDEAKVEVLEFVKFLQSPEKFTRLGAKIPKGALLCGPPGTGTNTHTCTTTWHDTRKWHSQTVH